VPIDQVWQLFFGDRRK